MNPSQLPRLGSVVWAPVQDERGFQKRRPAVVVTPTADIDSGKTLRIAAVTTRLPNPLPDDHVLLPWDAHGTARSGLRRKCTAVASWLVEVRAADIQVVGVLPPAVVDLLVAKIRTFTEPPADDH